LLTLENVSVAYGSLIAVNGVSVSVGAGEFITILGANGAGKTSLFKAISGTQRCSSGSIRFNDHDLLRTPADLRAKLGIAHVPEGRKVFKSMTVLENLQLGATTQTVKAFLIFLERAFGLFPILAERKQQLAGTLSGGEQQMLAIARGLASKPSLLMLDEPSMGLSPRISDRIFDAITTIHREEKIAILLVEQRIAECIRTCDRGYLLETGRVVLEAPPDRLTNDPRVKRAYLGL
jgi:branched-chain amino acid transport system ATP-binding protein